MIQGPTPGKVFEVSQDMVTVGREMNNAIIISDAEISRQHSRITRRRNSEGQITGYTIEDLGSTNGTFVNSLRLVGQRPLMNGEVINLGEKIALRFEAQTREEPYYSPSRVDQPVAPPPVAPAREPVAPPPVAPPVSPPPTIIEPAPVITPEPVQPSPVSAPLPDPGRVVPAPMEQPSYIPQEPAYMPPPAPAPQQPAYPQQTTQNLEEPSFTQGVEEHVSPLPAPPPVESTTRISPRVRNWIVGCGCLTAVACFAVAVAVTFYIDSQLGREFYCNNFAFLFPQCG